MAVQILFRRGTSSEWTSANPALGSGEPGIETNTGKIKVGDGTTLWNALPYAAGLESLRLQDLSDVTSTAPSTGQVLKWNGTAWAPAADATGSGGDGNTTYTVSAETATGGVDLRLTGSDSSTDNVKLAAGSNVTVTRTDASTITIAATGGGGGASNLDDLGDVVITGSPTTGQVLKFNGTNWVNGTDAISSGSNLTTRATAAGTSSSLTAGQTGPINITGYKSYALFKVQTSAAAWVRIYVSEAARAADASRLEGVDPAPSSGVIAEVITTGAETVLISPSTIGFNNESPVTTNIPVRVTNKSGSPAAITVTLTLLQLEA
jgi:hypothetical protein